MGATPDNCLPARMTATVRTSVPWARPRYVKRGEPVLAEPAHNQPRGGRIEWWIFPVDELLSPWFVDAIGSYGVGVSSDDLEIETED